MLKRTIVLVCAALLASCVPAEESNDRIKRYDPEDSIMGEIQTRGVLRIGIPSDYPPFAIVDEGSEPEGFVVDLGVLAAESLGVEAEFQPYPNAELLPLIEDDPKECDRDTVVDLVFPMNPITEDLVQNYTVTDPYWVGHSRELEGPPASSREVIGSFPAPDVELLKFAYENPGLRVTGEQQSTEGYGAASRCGTTTFGALVSQVINEADAEGDWSAFYEEWLAPYFADPAPEDVPIMSVEDAAALYPSELD